MTAATTGPTVRQVERRARASRVALLVGAAALVGAVALLRHGQAGGPALREAPPPTLAVAPTTVEKFADPVVVLPVPGDPPDTVGAVHSEAGDRTLRVRWAQAVSGLAPRGATGFDVRWGHPGALDNVMLVAAPEVELRGLTNGEQYDVEVRSVDAFGRRSAPVAGSGIPQPQPADPERATLTGLYDDFHTATAPDPRLWAVPRIRNCLLAGPGTGAEDDRLVLNLRCGDTPGGLRARVPMRLTGGPVLGRIMVTTDGPVPGGEFSIAAVPGPLTTLGLPAGGVLPAQPGRAVEDATLPAGAIRAVVTTDGARITAAPGAPRAQGPALVPSGSALLGAPGVTAQWELRFTTDGVTLRRNGELVASGDVLPSWEQATVLVGFAAPPGDTARLHVDAIGFSGQPSSPPNVVDVPGVLGGDVTYRTGDAGPASRRNFRAAPSAQAARLQVLAGPTARCVEDALSADFAPVKPPPVTQPPVTAPPLTLPLRAAVPGSVPANGPYCAYAAELTGELMDLLHRGGLVAPIIRTTDVAGASVSGALEMTYPPDAGVIREPATDPPGQPPSEQNRLAHLSAELRNAAGERLVEGEPVPRGRVVLAVTLDGLAGQRETGQLAGIAGIEVRLDGRLVAGLPTVSDGPAPAGEYPFALSVAQLTAGPHLIELRVLGARSGTRPRGLWLNFQVARS